MKKLRILWIFVIGILTVSSCTEILDTEPAGATFTEDQKLEVAELMPERLAADIAGLYSIMGQQWPVFPSSERADDFGYPSACISSDLNAADMTAFDNNYNWFSVASSFEDRNYTYANPFIRWSIFYQQIKYANDLLASIPEDTENEELLYYKGQALAIRAFDYFNLAQLFQFTYKGNEDKPCVPVVTAGMTDTENPRQTVAQIYTLVMEDLDAAIPLLDGYTRTSKGFVDQSVAYGIRARVNLVMNNWAAAQADAEAAMAGTTATIANITGPAFVSVDEPNWMWGIIINPVNISDTYENWPSKLSSLTSNSYTTAVDCYKMCNVLLFDKIPDTDVRKGWWVDADTTSALLTGLTWGDLTGNEIATGSITDVKTPFPPYTNVKFAADNYTPGDGTNASDWCIMRIEEMKLIQVEAMAKGGDIPGAKLELEDFIKTYRDPAYTCTATTDIEMESEVWLQRRIELWGEGFGFKDVMRLKRNIVNYIPGQATNVPSTWQFNLSADNEWLPLRIPQKEINSNTGISEEDNNTGGSIPEPGDGASLVDGVTNL